MGRPSGRSFHQHKDELMLVRITKSHINSNGPVRKGTVIEVDDAVAADYLNAKLAEPVKSGQVETAVKKTSKEKAAR
jgi:hypothetical protein